MPEKTVMVRGREETPTKDISIPARIARDYDIELGDEFVIDTTIDNEGKVVLRYTRISNSNLGLE